MKSWPIGPLSLLLALAMGTACSRIPSSGEARLGAAARAKTQLVAGSSFSSRHRLAAETTGLVITFAKPALQPLPDKAKDAETGAQRTAITIQANRNGVPVPKARVRLQASFGEQSGGHVHDESRRPVGAFYNAKSLGSDTVVTANDAGQIRLT